jgi:hypothetical protein
MHDVGGSAGVVGGGATQVECVLGADARSLTRHKLLPCFTPHTHARARARAQKYRERTRDHLGDVVPDGFDAIHGAAVGAVTGF